MLGEGHPGAQDGRRRVDEFQLYDSIMVDHDRPNLLFTPREQYCKDLDIDDMAYN
jgi:hypothetical protein